MLFVVSFRSLVSIWSICVQCDTDVTSQSITCLVLIVFTLYSYFNSHVVFDFYTKLIREDESYIITTIR